MKETAVSLGSKLIGSRVKNELIQAKLEEFQTERTNNETNNNTSTESTIPPSNIIIIIIVIACSLARESFDVSKSPI